MTKPVPRPAHRPPDDGVPATERVYLRMTPARKARWTAAAKRAGLTLSRWMTALADREADR